MGSACASFDGLASVCDVRCFESVETTTLAAPKFLLQGHDVLSLYGNLCLRLNDIKAKKIAAMMVVSNRLDFLMILEQLGTKDDMNTDFR